MVSFFSMSLPAFSQKKEWQNEVGDQLAVLHKYKSLSGNPTEFPGNPSERKIVKLLVMKQKKSSPLMMKGHTAVPMALRQGAEHTTYALALFACLSSLRLPV